MYSVDNFERSMNVALPANNQARFLNGERTALFIDGMNFYSASRAIGTDVDYRKMLSYFHSQTTLVRALYYTTVLDTNDETYSPVKPLIDWLGYNGFHVNSKTAKEFTDSTGRRRFKGNMDIEMAVDMLELAGSINHMILFSGNAEFRKLVEALQRRGVRVSVVSSIRSSPPVCADELRRQADQFIDLMDIVGHFTRRQNDRSGPPPMRGATPADPDGDM
jgi:uncharacterized LabA/DUF88 family protein